MKPVIKKQTHYNLLLMRDDSAARTFRMHSKLLRFLLYFFLLLIAGGALGIAGGVHYWKKYHDLVGLQKSQERELSEIRLQLERLSNLETLIVASNGTVPQAKNEEVGASPLPRPLNATVAVRDAEAATRNGTDAARNATVAEALPEQQNATLADSGEAEAGQEGQHNATTQSNSAASGIDPHSLDSDESPVRVGRFTARNNGYQRLRISYELSTTNPEDQRTVSGNARYVAAFTNGTRQDLSLSDADGTRFSIQRMKAMQSLARLPQGYDMDEIETVDVYIEISDGNTYHSTFPVLK